MSSSAHAALLFVALTGGACGPSTDDGGDDAAATTTTTTTAETADTEATGATGATSVEPGPETSATSIDPDSGTETTAPIDCGDLDVDECQSAATCQTVRGGEATQEGEPGSYYCSDLLLVVGCAPVECETVAGTFLLCNLDDPSVVFWTFDTCIPPGWEICPDAMCG